MPRRLQAGLPDPPRGPPVTGSLSQLLAIDISQDFLSSELWPLHTLKVLASLMHFGNIICNAHYDRRTLCGPSSLVNSELTNAVRLQQTSDDNVSPEAAVVDFVRMGETGE